MKPVAADLDLLLRACIQCGLCLPHCATYLATADERLSPRGRLLLLRRILDGGPGGVDRSLLASFDLCLGCDACAGVCPSGLHPTVLERARELSFAARGAPWIVRAAAGPRGLRRITRAGRRARGAARAIWGPAWRVRLGRGPRPLALAGRLLGSLPAVPGSDRAVARALGQLVDGRAAAGASVAGAGGDGRPRTAPADGPPVVLLSGCAEPALLPGTGSRLARLLAAGGCRLLPSPEAVCCGAGDRHAGRRAVAGRRLRRALAALTPGAAEAATIVVAAAGCGRELRGTPAPVGPRTVDALVMLCGLPLPPPRPVPLRVVLHDPCHALHGQGIDREPRRLLRAIPGLTLLEPEEREVCCGAGGPYALRHPGLSARMGRRKARALAATGADLAVTANVACLGQLQDGLAEEGIPLPVLPLVDLLWFAHLGEIRQDEI